MASTVWTGAILFAGARIPVKLSSAARAETLSFSQVHLADMSPVKQMLRCAAEDRVLQRTEIGKAYEAEPGRFVLIEDADLERAKPNESEIELAYFARSIDPTYFRDHYHVLPSGNDEKWYATLFCALRKTAAIGIARIFLHHRQSVAAVRAGRTGILLHTLYFHSEVRHLNEFRTDATKVADKEIALAARLIRRQTAIGDVQFDRFTDGYRANMLRIIAEKSQASEAA